MNIRNTAFIFVCLLIFLPVNNVNAEKAENPFSALLNGLFKQPQNSQNKENSSKTETPSYRERPSEEATEPLQKQVIFSGYSQAFVPLKSLIASGMVAEAARVYAENDEKAEYASNNKDQRKRTEEMIRSHFRNEPLKKGMRGPNIVEVQKKLNAKGFGSGSTDGIFGPATENAVIEFQRSNGLKANGVVDQSTWNVLHEKNDYAATSLFSSRALAFLEGGTLYIDCGDFDEAVERFACAEDLFAKREKGSKLGSWVGKAGAFGLETLLGYEELQSYKGEGYERVLMLNYKSIAYLLQGERKAYNVTRRAINWQNIEKKRFDKKLRAAKKNLAEEEQKEKNNDIFGLNLSKTVEKEYASMEAKAISVSNAYVNPFGYYVAGMIQEFEGFDDLSLRDNARISYKKALDLNPESEVLKKAVKDLKNSSPPPDKRLVHVVVADGFVPEKKLLILPLSIKETAIPIKLPLYQPVPSQVHSIEVSGGNGQKLANLSPVADIEAICLRHQKDCAPFRYLRVLLATGRTYFAKKLLSRAGSIGQVAGDELVAAATPDMRSWMSLPANIQAARFYVPKDLKKIKITTYDKKGRRLASKTVNLDTSSHNFVYARSIDKTLYAHANKKMWLVIN